MAETFDWIKPSPLWQPAAQDMLQSDFFRPALLEFRSDDFVKDFLALAAKQSPGFRNAIAQPPQSGQPLKLFQPAHGNFYLTSASLCCRLPGFPDREVLKGDGENAFFVLRKKVKGVEFGWVSGDTRNGWRQVTNKPLLDNEEQLPLFPATTGQNRNIFFGYVPVSSRETYAASGADSPVTADVTSNGQADTRLDELDGRFIEPLRRFAAITASAPETIARRISVYMLLELLEYLDQYLPNAGAVLRAKPDANPNAAEGDLLTAFGNQIVSGSLTLKAALIKVADEEAGLNQPGEVDVNDLGFTIAYGLQSLSARASDIRSQVGNALQSRPETLPPPVKVPKLSQKSGDKYILRYVYQRPQCDQQQLYISQPTAEFELAPFFDPDAPARPIRIGLPVDVSIGGLRKFKKSVAFMMSKELRNKLAMVSPDTLKGNVDGEGAETLGHICSFSIPIITLCAFILLMIILSLLNIVFWWIPLLKICFPLNLKAKV